MMLRYLLVALAFVVALVNPICYCFAAYLIKCRQVRPASLTFGLVAAYSAVFALLNSRR